MLNIVSPSLLMNNFVKAYKNNPVEKLVINISSGAAQKAYESWSTYCASKSGLDMYTSVAFLEQGLTKTVYPVRFFSIAPGIVDTMMQDEIREADPEKFAQLDKFKRYKNENLLASPAKTANRLVKFIENQHRFDKPLIDLRETDI
jgi:benzil reductase ((S)-benzoin forming)